MTRRETDNGPGNAQHDDAPDYPQAGAYRVAGCLTRSVGRLSLVAMTVLGSTLLSSAAEPTHCYAPGTAPFDATVPTEQQTNAAAGLTFGYHLIPVIYRRFCGTANFDDRTYLASVLAPTGCSEQSHAGRKQLAVIEDDGVLRSLASPIYRVSERHSEFTGQFCGLVAQMPWPLSETSSDAQKQESVRVLRAADELTRSYQNR